MTTFKKPPLNLKVIAIAGAVLVLGAGITYFAVKGGTPNDVVVAKINGTPVTLEQANLRIKMMQQGQGKKISFNDLPAESKSAIIQEEAAHRMLIKDAKKQNLLSRKTINKETDVFVDNLFQKAILEKVANAAVSDEKVKAAYDKESERLQGQQEIRARHILVKTPEEAQAVKEALTTKAFKDVAKEMSIDQKTAKEGGDLGVLYTGNMLKEFDEAISKLKSGEISEPVKSEFGWHIIKLDSRNPAKILPFDQAKDAVTIDISKKAIKEYVDGLLKNVKIDIL